MLRQLGTALLEIERPQQGAGERGGRALLRLGNRFKNASGGRPVALPELRQGNQVRVLGGPMAAARAVAVGLRAGRPACSADASRAQDVENAREILSGKAAQAPRRNDMHVRAVASVWAIADACCARPA